MAESVADILREGPQLRETLRNFGLEPQTAVDSYLATTLGFGGIVAADYAGQAVLRLRGGEAGGTAAPRLRSRRAVGPAAARRGGVGDGRVAARHRAAPPAVGRGAPVGRAARLGT